MDKTKPFDIPKQRVKDAFTLVKANAGSAGVDNQSIADFEKDLKDNLWVRLIWNDAIFPKNQRINRFKVGLFL